MLIYKICDEASWRAAERVGQFDGSPLDRADGYIHMSPATEVASTLDKHFAGRTDLLLVAVDRSAIEELVRDEPSRGGALFPHLYGVLPMTAVVWCEPIATSADGGHRLPDVFFTNARGG